MTGLGLSRGENLVDQTANADTFVEVSAILKAHAASLVKICGDLRILALLGEIRLPGLQAGSSIMPGKVNPVLLEAAIQAGMKVMANDALIADACSRGSLQINEFLPLVSFSLHESLELLTRIDRALAPHVKGITADEKRCRCVLREEPDDRYCAAPPHRVRTGNGADRRLLRLRERRTSWTSSPKSSGRIWSQETFSPQRLVASDTRKRHA